jgi:hypothetical protein
MNRFLLSAGLVLSVIPAQATNMGFIPGDAFFHSQFTKEVADSIPEDGGTITLSYMRPDHAQFYLCGYGGFYKLEVRNIPPEIGRALKSLREKMHADSGTNFRVNLDNDGKETHRYEVDPPRLFIYGKEFDPEEHDFGLKYNERWNAPPTSTTNPKKGTAIGYDNFVKGEKAVVTDWLYAERMPGLPVTTPEGVNWGTSGKQIEEAAFADAADVRFFVLDGGDMRRYFNKKKRMRFWEVTSEGYRVSEYTKPYQLKTKTVPLDEAEKAVDYHLFADDEEGDEEEVSKITPAEAWETD